MKPPGTNAGSGSISRLAPQFADRRPRMPRPSLPNAPKAQNSNRESLRRVRADDSARRNDEVTAVTPTKQTLPISSNREEESLFSPVKFPLCRGAGLPRSRVGRGFCKWAVWRNPKPPRAAGEPPSLRSPHTADYETLVRKMRRKTNSRPPSFVAIRKNYVIGFIRLKEVF
jgi:hypothetical protein